VPPRCCTFLLYRAEPAPLRTPADTRPVEILSNLPRWLPGTTHAIGIARPAITAGAQMGADRYVLASAGRFRQNADAQDACWCLPPASQCPAWPAVSYLP
jgi:hypothetical protein